MKGWRYYFDKRQPVSHARWKCFVNWHMQKTILSAITLILICCATYAQHSAKKDSIPYGNNKAAGHYVKLRGINMYYETYGEGQPLLMIHGNSGSINAFEKQIPFFSKKYKVIVADSRDHGNTLDTLNMQDSLTYEMMADDYAALLDALHIDSAFVLGWSDGGINGLLLSMNYPKKVKKLAVTGANLWPDSTAVDPFILKMFTAQHNVFKKNRKDGGAQAIVLERHFRLMLTQPHISLEHLKKIHCPTLVIGGDHDVILPKHTLQIAEAIPKSYCWIAPIAGHGVIFFQYELFNQEVEKFFKTPYIKIAGYELFRH